MLYGNEKECTSIKEYNEQLKRSTETLTSIMEALNKYMRNSQFSSLGYILSWITVVDMVGWFKKHFAFFLEFDKYLLGIPELKKKNSGLFETSMMLGEWQSTYRRPEEIDSIDDNEKIKPGFLVLNTSFITKEVRIEKKLNTEYVIFKNVSKKDILELTSIMSKMNSSYIDYSRAANKFFGYLNSNNITKITLNLLSGVPGVVGMLAYTLLSRRYKMWLHINLTIFENLGRVFKIGKSTYKQSTAIIKKSISKS